MRPVSLAIVGIRYPNKTGPARLFELRICTPGEPVELRSEPSNPHDEHAIAVFSCRGVQLGYLASERAVWIGLLMRQGRTVTAVFQGMTETAGWLRLAFDGEVPTLPAARAEEEGEPDFWPDEVWPDE
jgi:hypothetical protein